VKTTVAPVSTTVWELPAALVANNVAIESGPASAAVSGTGGGDISPVFSALSVIGFLLCVALLGRRWYETRP
jgi:hypothetical protein